MLSRGKHTHYAAFRLRAWIDPARKMILVRSLHHSGFGHGGASDLRAAFQTLAVEALGE